MKKFLIATRNKGKFIEIKEILDSLPFEFISLDDINIQEDVHEHGKTFNENAKIKAEFFGDLSGFPTIADDSGIIIEALKNELGVETRRWGAGKDATDEEWIEFFLNRMKEENNRNAEFVCSAAVYIDGEMNVFEGKTSGVVLDSLQAEYLPGLPLSAVFKPDGCGHVFSALTVEEKNKISHRGKAFGKVRESFKDFRF